jgi:hypothetical protein
MANEGVRVLHLTLHRKWFDAIATGKKKTEYRAITPYWDKRLCPNGLAKVFDEVHFRNGYSPSAPWMRVVWRYLSITFWQGEAVHGIELGRVMEIKNWTGPRPEEARGSEAR